MEFIFHDYRTDKCPFKRRAHGPEGIAGCPLYVESHAGRGLGCVDDLAQHCRVTRGRMNFDAAVLDLARRGIAHPGMVDALNPRGKA